MEKIKARTEEEKTPIGKMERGTKIMKILTSCFEKESCDDKDSETILDWACLGIEKEKLIYLLEKIKFERLK